MRANPAADLGGLMAGPLSGATAWAASYAMLTPAGIYKPISEYPPAVLWQDFSAHLVFGSPPDRVCRAHRRANDDAMSGALDAGTAGRRGHRRAVPGGSRRICAPAAWASRYVLDERVTGAAPA